MSLIYWIIIYYLIGSVIVCVNEFKNSLYITIQDIVFMLFVSIPLWGIVVPIWLISNFFDAEFWHIEIWKKK